MRHMKSAVLDKKVTFSDILKVITKIFNFLPQKHTMHHDE